VGDQATVYIAMRFRATPIQTSGYLEGGSYIYGRDAEICYTGNPFSSEYSVEKLVEEMSPYTHVYLHDVWDEFEEKYGELFAGEIRKDTLYRITTDDDGNVKLVYVD
ncbi:MAG: hypothetical protein K2M36_05590, partial [Clostridia bacterium]|nr:hypothetical protein [Clostridia bacterium]